MSDVPTPARRPQRILVEAMAPSLDGGRWPVKRTLGDPIHLSAAVLRDGHEAIAAEVTVADPTGGLAVHPLRPAGEDRFEASLRLGRLGLHRLEVVAWVDRWGSWREEVRRKVGAGQADLAGECAEGARLLATARRRLPAAARPLADEAREALSRGDPVPALAEAVAEAVAASGACRGDVSRSARLPVDVDRELATFGAWYELFPRSFGGLAGVAAALPRLAELGFDVVYLPPIHPIGRVNRKGRDNAPTAAPGDVGSPWAIGAAEGGHTAVHPDLGTVADLVALAGAARDLGMEIALDLALQCAPDHPWLTEHPEWFEHRPDGTIKHAENPPKRYEDIHNLDFGCDDWRGLWAALVDVVLTWVGRGIRIFRVDNPHTKPFPFWEWLIREVRRRDPAVIFLAEAFTRPAVMRALGKVGFSQSYTYFTWKNSRAELTELVGLMRDWSDCVRPNLFTNTPDILNAYLQEGGPPAFVTRLVLAATLGPSYGIYSGFEHFERVPVRPGSEEYLSSEKYQLRERDLDGPLLPLVARLNAIRRERPALRRLDPTTVLETRSDRLFAYARGRGPDTVVVCVNLDPHHPAEGACVIPGELGLGPAFAVRDLLGDGRWRWRTGDNYVRLDPAGTAAHVLVPEPT